MKKGRKVSAAVLTALAAAWLTLFVALMLETTARCCDIRSTTRTGRRTGNASARNTL